MNIAAPFIHRPIGTTLMAIGLFLTGLAAYVQLPVASLPSIDFPTIMVSASRPGAAPEIMASTVAAPLERRLGEISGVTELTSTSSLGGTRIVVQFDMSRNIDGAARDVQAALNAAQSDLPSDLPSVPTFRKANPSGAPVLILALTSKTLAPAQIYDIADTVIAQRISQVDGVADVAVSGAEQPAIRVRVNPGTLSAMATSIDDIRAVIAAANAMGPMGTFDGPQLAETIGTNDQLRNADEYKHLVVKTTPGGAVVRLGDIATIESGTRNTRSAAWFNAQPGVLLVITKQGDANVIDTVDKVLALVPQLQKWIPAGIEVTVLSDRTRTIRASVHDMQMTLALTVVLVMLVVLVFLRRGAATLAAGITVPLSLAGTVAAMWAAGYSVNNLTLMALAVSVGFVVDDAIVMIENAFRNLERGKTPLQATIDGARQIGFTVVSISVSLVAAFIPLLFMTGVVGRLLREFSVTLVFAIVVSTLVSLTVTPMICARLVKQPPSPDATIYDRLIEGMLSRLVAGYRRTLKLALRWQAVMLVIMVATVVITVDLYIKAPKGYFPQDDTGLVFGSTRASPDISFQAMVDLQQQVMQILVSDPSVEAVGSSVSGGDGGSVNQGRMFINLKPRSVTGETTAQVIARLRPKLLEVGGMQVFMTPAADIRAGGRSSRSTYQFTLWSPELDQLLLWSPKVIDRLQRTPGLTDVNNDREQGGLQLNATIDRTVASRLGVKIADIDTALNNAFAQRQISTIYSARNQYRVILEVDPLFQRDPSDLARVFVTGTDRAQVPLSAVVKFDKGLAPLVINHQGQFPSVTISYNLEDGATLQQAQNAIQQAVADLRMPDSIRAEAAGDAAAFAKSANAQPLLILAALVAVYIVLGVLYESLAHPITIISTLPSAGLGALLALQVAGAELTTIALIGIILLIGIVKKNGIMLVDFALEAEREHGRSPEEAIFEACMERFRPILMTTLAALLGALPLLLATGPGSELRRPLGITIVGGLFVSQILTLYTTPVVYLLLDRLHRKLWGGGEHEPSPAAAE